MSMLPHMERAASGCHAQSLAPCVEYNPSHANYQAEGAVTQGATTGWIGLTREAIVW